MQVNLKRVQKRRIFSEQLRRKVVQEYEKGKMTIIELSRSYMVSETSIYNWINKYSNFEKQAIQIVEMKFSNTEKIKELEQKIQELERTVGVKQIKIDFLEKMAEIAKEDYGFDIKKKPSIQPSTGSEKTEKK